jgi:hypothetical protein
MANKEILDSNNIIYERYLPNPYPYPIIWTPHFGQFSSSQSQTITGVNQPTVITHDTTEQSNGIIYDPLNPSRIVVSRTGTYKFSYSVQLDKSGGGTSPVDMFIKINNNPVPNSSSRTVVVGQNGENFLFCEYILSLNINNYVETVFYSADNTMTITAFPQIVGPPIVPAVPSIITTIIQIA